MCYTDVALSDLVVSSGLPFTPASLPGTDFSPSPYSVYPQVSLPEALHRTEEKFAVRVRVFATIVCLLDWTGSLDRSKSTGRRNLH